METLNSVIYISAVKICGGDFLFIGEVGFSSQKEKKQKKMCAM